LPKRDHFYFALTLFYAGKYGLIRRIGAPFLRPIYHKDDTQDPTDRDKTIKTSSFVNKILILFHKKRKSLIITLPSLISKFKIKNYIKMNVSKFIKDNISLCVCTLGIAIAGYLGCHAVCWIISKCQKTEKVDRIAQEQLSKNNENLGSSPNPGSQSKSNATPSKPAKSLINRVSSLDIPEGKINRGQGEYIVFHKLPNDETKEVSKETYEQVYEILNAYAPAAIVERSSESIMEECENRYEIIKAKIKDLDPTLELVFVPRTLYELIFIRKCIKEDLKHNKICPLLSKTSHTTTVDFFEGDQEKFRTYEENRKKLLTERKCWHLCYFDNVGDNNHPGVRDVAYRLNRIATKTLSPKTDGFTYKELSKHTENEIEFLKNHYKKGLDEIKKLQKGIKVHSIDDCSTPGPTTNFGYESIKGSIKPMGIRDDKDAQIIRNAITLECSKIAQRAFILYRGADFQKDSANCWNERDKPYSLSFGSSLFAGCLFDGGATAFYYMRNGKNAYAIPVPFHQLNSSPFFIPPTNTTAQLFGDGEIFHSRTKAWKDYDLKQIGGMNMGANGHQRDHLKSELSKQELTTQFQNYKNQAIQLKCRNLKIGLLEKASALITFLMKKPLGLEGASF